MESFVVLMAVHYGPQDKFMLSLNVTKHRNKHFTNAPSTEQRAEERDGSDILRPDHFPDTHHGNSVIHADCSRDTGTQGETGRDRDGETDSGVHGL